MTLKELGQALRQAREARGMSLKDAEKRTKIAARIISSIEEGRNDSFPHPVYAKGFVKTYARLLEFDAELVRSVVEQEFVDDSDDDPVLPPPKLVVKPRRRTAPLVAGLLVVVLLAAGGYLAYRYLVAPVVAEKQQRSDTVQSNGSSVPAAAVPAVSTPSAAEGNATSVQGNAAESAEPVNETGKASSGAASRAVAPAPAEMAVAADTAGTGAQTAQQSVPQKAPVAPPVPAVPVPQAEQAPVAGQKKAAAAGEQQLRVEARLDCWIEARMDDVRDQELFLRAGQAVVFRFDKSLSVKLGNGGGVDVKLNGRAVPVEAAPGDVVTLQFP
jgi:cytoskeleton protein RodZ